MDAALDVMPEQTIGNDLLTSMQDRCTAKELCENGKPPQPVGKTGTQCRASLYDRSNIFLCRQRLGIRPLPSGWSAGGPPWAVWPSLTDCCNPHLFLLPLLKPMNAHVGSGLIQKFVKNNYFEPNKANLVESILIW
jgi:hypothetical protein